MNQFESEHMLPKKQFDTAISIMLILLGLGCLSVIFLMKYKLENDYLHHQIESVKEENKLLTSNLTYYQKQCNKLQTK
jgi:hypothetical protein